MRQPVSLKEMLETHAAPMALGYAVADEWVRCLACGHRCLIPPNRSGVCKVRFNRDGVLMGPHGYVAMLQDDPIEKKPFFHAFPGSRAFSFGMLGCGFHCGYCQNWLTSQTLRDTAADASAHPISVEQIVMRARETGALTVTSTYNEPLITAEWAVEVFRLARNAGLVTSVVSNGHGSREAISYLQPHLDLYKADLKGFDDRRYRKLGGTLKNVLDSIEQVYRSGLWLEVVTVVVPGFNDSNAELRHMAGFIAEISPDVPWHLTSFRPAYRMTDVGATPTPALTRAYEIGKETGLRYVYPRIPSGAAETLDNTRCPHCDTLLVQRVGLAVRGYHLQEGRCPTCQAEIAGRWHTAETLPRMSLTSRGEARPLRP